MSYYIESLCHSLLFPSSTSSIKPKIRKCGSSFTLPSSSSLFLCLNASSLLEEEEEVEGNSVFWKTIVEVVVLVL